MIQVRICKGDPSCQREPAADGFRNQHRPATKVEATYMGEKRIVASIGDVVMAPGNVRAIVIAANGIQVKVLGIGTSKETGDTFVLSPPYIHDYPASQCHYLEKQTLNR